MDIHLIPDPAFPGPAFSSSATPGSGAGYRLRWRDRRGQAHEAACVIGRGGIIQDKREGDGGTPVGCFPLRRVLYRPDRVSAPVTALPVVALTPDGGWCDDPTHPDYNRPVTLPFPAGHEVMWRDDHVYDIVVVLGHNDAPPVPGLGSAIFMHLTRPDRAATAGCTALDLDDLRRLLSHCQPGDRLCVPDQGPIP
ncbi:MULTISPECIES: L,D-transpeptidase family protein [Nitrospirillum]|uniref:L,D-transpeptidase-like protein n=1 Tax=Nitrospirillum amazonense TaxID=28077 RepID=A0A560FG12_9PROT|nr:L,D-transpeptidase family protein [Nitrospirillum amazonense]MEC4594158.1 L,D-transpeptidase family protein [Nitrospirillum amazonense]TWB20557.1 L,D-transpeptidase-like protein [Nitrospirillum amazonense]